MLNLQTQGVLTQPIYILWVEPYLTGGHLLYFPPGHGIDYSSLFETGYYRYNIVDVEEYKKPDNRMLLREAGCQTSYAPYSQEYVTLFLSKIFPELRCLIRNPSTDACAFSLLINHDAIRQQKLKRSNFAMDILEGEIVRTKL